MIKLMELGNILINGKTKGEFLYNGELIVSNVAYELFAAISGNELDVIELIFSKENLAPSNLNVDKLIINNIIKLEERRDIKILNVKPIDCGYSVILVKDYSEDTGEIISRNITNLLNHLLVSVNTYILV